MTPDHHRARDFVVTERPIVVAPQVDFARLRDPSIIDAF
jgi:hypothetical protein